jgi:hypothetical protein
MVDFIFHEVPTTIPGGQLLEVEIDNSIDYRTMTYMIGEQLLKWLPNLNGAILLLKLPERFEGPKPGSISHLTVGIKSTLADSINGSIAIWNNEYDGYIVIYDTNNRFRFGHILEEID